MNVPDQHPDSVLLDRLRAGLLDDHPTEKAEIDAHIQRCDACRRSYDWPGVVRSDKTQDEHLNRRLDQARQRALLSRDKSALRRFVPLAAAAALALVTVLVVKPLQLPDGDEPRLAATSPAAVPEVYEDLDFYLWLADHETSEDSST